MLVEVEEREREVIEEEKKKKKEHLKWKEKMGMRAGGLWRKKDMRRLGTVAVEFRRL